MGIEKKETNSERRGREIPPMGGERKIHRRTKQRPSDHGKRMEFVRCEKRHPALPARGGTNKAHFGTEVDHKDDEKNVWIEAQSYGNRATRLSNEVEKPSAQ